MGEQYQILIILKNFKSSCYYVYILMLIMHLFLFWKALKALNSDSAYESYIYIYGNILATSVGLLVVIRIGTFS